MPSVPPPLDKIPRGTKPAGATADQVRSGRQPPLLAIADEMIAQPAVDLAMFVAE
jgi:hypothetical protein